MNTHTKISVVIPCFNAERYIAATLRSVLAQGWPSMEILVIDDGSSDRSAELVRTSFPNVTLLSQRNQGAAAARNLGIEHARGEWIAFLDADDIWLPGKLRAQWDMLCSVPSSRMSYGAWKVWTSSAAEPAADYLEVLLRQSGETSLWAGPTGWIYPQLLLDCEVWTSTVLAHHSLFEEVGAFDTTLPIGEDYDLWLRASRVTPILRISRPLALYRAHSTSLSHRQTTTNYRALVVLRALERWGYVSPDGAIAPREDVHRALAHSWTTYAASHLEAGNLASARYGGRMALHHNLWHASAWKVLVKALARTLRLVNPSPPHLTQ